MPENKELRLTSLSTFEKLFDDHHIILCVIACDIVKSKDLAEEIVDEVFINLWQKGESILIYKSKGAYWEKTAQFNVGIELWLIKNRINLTAELVISLIDQKNHFYYSFDYKTYVSIGVDFEAKWG